jgi:N-methylhydantoinase A
MRQDAEAIVRRAAPDAELIETWTADMRYHGQGHELAIVIPNGTALNPANLKALFERHYVNQFGRVIPDLDVEVLNWTLRLSAPEPEVQSSPPPPPDRKPRNKAATDIIDPETGKPVSAGLYARAELAPGDVVPGPALIIEDETTTFVAARYEARINGLGYIVLTRS